MRDSPTRASLLSRMRDPADEPAWTEFDELYRDLVLGWCRRAGLQPWDAEDVRQVVMMSLAGVLQRGFRYRPEMGRFRDYLARMVRNVIASRSSGGAAVVLCEADELADRAASDSFRADGAWEEEWQDHHLRLALRRLRGAMGARNRAIFERMLAGASGQELAEAFDMSEVAIRKVKQRVLEELRELVLTQIRDEEAFRS